MPIFNKIVFGRFILCYFYLLIYLFYIWKLACWLIKFLIKIVSLIKYKKETNAIAHVLNSWVFVPEWRVIGWKSEEQSLTFDPAL